ncbi:uncharacterized protein BJ171DRAFT_501123, partial [Polychytrium aggregatum]|uniref:uncharacterized protein n=1 Tax=Polychytrium aggregatum TaxID=110093 RepID=UPI0022FDD17E
MGGSRERIPPCMSRAIQTDRQIKSTGATDADHQGKPSRTQHIERRQVIERRQAVGTGADHTAAGRRGLSSAESCSVFSRSCRSSLVISGSTRERRLLRRSIEALVNSRGDSIVVSIFWSIRAGYFVMDTRTVSTEASDDMDWYELAMSGTDRAVDRGDSVIWVFWFAGEAERKLEASSIIMLWVLESALGGIETIRSPLRAAPGANGGSSGYIRCWFLRSRWVRRKTTAARPPLARTQAPTIRPMVVGASPELPDSTEGVPAVVGSEGALEADGASGVCGRATRVGCATEMGAAVPRTRLTLVEVDWVEHCSWRRRQVVMVAMASQVPGCSDGAESTAEQEVEKKQARLGPSPEHWAWPGVALLQSTTGWDEPLAWSAKEALNGAAPPGPQAAKMPSPPLGEKVVL